MKATDMKLEEYNTLLKAGKEIRDKIEQAKNNLENIDFKNKDRINTIINGMKESNNTELQQEIRDSILLVSQNMSYKKINLHRDYVIGQKGFGNTRYYSSRARYWDKHIDVIQALQDLFRKTPHLIGFVKKEDKKEVIKILQKYIPQFPTMETLVTQIPDRHISFARVTYRGIDTKTEHCTHAGILCRNAVNLKIRDDDHMTYSYSGVNMNLQQELDFSEKSFLDELLDDNETYVAILDLVKQYKRLTKEYERVAKGLLQELAPYITIEKLARKE
jgi:hypothetical protein